MTCQTTAVIWPACERLTCTRQDGSDATCVLAPPYTCHVTHATRLPQQHCLDMNVFATSLAYLSLQPSGLLHGEDA